MPILLMGDLNSMPDNSVTHLLMDKRYSTESDLYGTYKNKNGSDKVTETNMLEMVKKVIKSDSAQIDSIRGRLQSVYSLYNDRYFDSKAETDLRWSRHFPKCHPPYSIWKHHFNGWLDYIYYTP